jgi:hypothetical protein
MIKQLYFHYLFEFLFLFRYKNYHHGKFCVSNTKLNLLKYVYFNF